MNSACDQYIEPDIVQTPNEAIVYTVNWPARNLPEGVTIASQQFLPSGPTDYTISNTSIVDGGLQTQFMLTGGIPGTLYGITNRIVLSDTETMEDTLLFSCVSQNTRQRSTCI